MLTESGGVLVRDQPLPVDSNADVTFTCPTAIPPQQKHWMHGPQPVLNGDLLIEAVTQSLIAAYEVPGHELATKGWVAPRGNLRRVNSAPRGICV